MARRKKELLDLLKRKKQVARAPRPPAVKAVSAPHRSSQKNSGSPRFTALKDHPVWQWMPAAAALIFALVFLDFLFRDCQGVALRGDESSVVTTSDGGALASSFSIMAGTYSASDPQRASDAAIAVKEQLDPDSDGFPSVQLLQPLEYPDILEIYVGSASSKEELQDLFNQVKQITMPGQIEPEFRHSAYIRPSHRIQ